MKKIIALMLCAVMAFALVACASKGDDTTADANTEPQTTVTDSATDTAADTTGAATDPESTEPDTTEEPGTEPDQTTADVTTEEPGTEPESTEPVTTEEPTTTAPETTKPETTAPETTKPETTKPETTKPETTVPETEPAKEIPDNAYVFADRIYVIKPEGYTFKDFAGAPSGLKDGVAEGQCFFNFSLIDPTGVMTEEVARNTLEGQKATIGDDYTLDSFKSYEVDGVPVTKLDYTWGNGGLIAQSMVLVNFEDKTVFIAYATLTSIEGAIDEFNAMIDSLTIIAK